MHKKLAIFLTIVLVLACSEIAQPQIIGKWASDSRTKGGLGTLLIFEKDGTTNFIFGALVDFKYQTDGKTLKTTFLDTSTGKAETDFQPYEIVNNILILNPGDPKKRQEMTRVDTPMGNKPPIVGIWTFKHYTGGMATMEYTSGGLAQLSVPFESAKGNYQLRSNKLVVEVSGKPTIKTKIRLEGDHLIFLSDGKREEIKYTRVIP